MTTAETRTGRCPVIHNGGEHYGYEPFQMKDPFPSYERLREEAPVVFDERIGYYVVTRYDDIKAIFADPHTFSSENTAAAGPAVRPAGEADHGRRRLLGVLGAQLETTAGTHPYPLGRQSRDSPPGAAGSSRRSESA